MADVSVEADQFGAALSELLDGIGNEVRSKVPTAVTEAAKKGRSEVKKNARGSFTFHKGDKYLGGWTYRVVKNGADDTSATIGNSAVPGLPHLLEKGHATVGSNGVKRVAGRPHIAPAAESAFSEFERAVGKVVDDL